MTSTLGKKEFHVTLVGILTWPYPYFQPWQLCRLHDICKAYGLLCFAEWTFFISSYYILPFAPTLLFFWSKLSLFTQKIGIQTTKASMPQALGHKNQPGQDVFDCLFTMYYSNSEQLLKKMFLFSKFSSSLHGKVSVSKNRQEFQMLEITFSDHKFLLFGLKAFQKCKNHQEILIFRYPYEGSKFYCITHLCEIELSRKFTV